MTDDPRERAATGGFDVERHTSTAHHRRVKAHQNPFSKRDKNANVLRMCVWVDREHARSVFPVNEHNESRWREYKQWRDGKVRFSPLVSHGDFLHSTVVWWYVGQGKPVTDENCQIVHRTAMVSAQADSIERLRRSIHYKNHTKGSSAKRVFYNMFLSKERLLLSSSMC